MQIKIMKNMEPAPYMGSRFGQDVEAKGTYVLEKDHDYPLSQNWVEGRAEIKNPLIIPVNDENLIRYKYDLAAKYKAKGKRLTEKLMALGYDAIVTKYDKGYTGEIVLFPNCNFMLNLNETKTLIKNLLRENLFIENKSTNSYIAYHGSDTKFNSFSDEFVGGKEALDQEGPGIYFTTSLDNAIRYGTNVYKVELKPKNPVSRKEGKNAPSKQIEWLIKQAPDWKETAQNFHENPNVGLKIAVRDFIQYNENPHQQFLQVWYDFYRDNPVQYVRNMVKLGYDSIIVEGLRSMFGEDDVTHIIVLDLSIINFLEYKNYSEEK